MTNFIASALISLGLMTSPQQAEVETKAAIPTMVVEAAKKHGIDPHIALAIAHHESRFNCSAVGRSGELGVMQVKPATARVVGVTGNLKDCRTGIEAGMLYLKQAFARHGKDCAGISAYQRGIYGGSSCSAYGRKILATAAKKQTT